MQEKATGMEVKPTTSNVPTIDFTEYRERLAAVPQNEPSRLFSTVRQIGIELDREMAATVERLTFIEEDLPSKLQYLKRAKNELADFRQRVLDMQKDYKQHCDTVLGLVSQHAPELIGQLESLSEKQTELARLKCISKSEKLAANCVAAMESENPVDAYANFFQLVQHNNKVVSEGDEDTMDKCREHVDEIVKKVSEFASSSLLEQLDTIRYPFDESVDIRSVGRNVESAVSSTRLLVATKDWSEKDTGFKTVVELIFERFRKRFHFHFYGDRKTNDEKRPEWYFAQLSSWLHHSLPLFMRLLHEVPRPSDVRSAADQFVEMIGKLANEKTSQLLKRQSLEDDSLLFTHLVDECVQFENTRRGFDPSHCGPSALLPFCEDTVMCRWAGIEQAVCSARVDELLQGEQKWAGRFGQLHATDTYRVCECADSLVGLLDQLAKRAEMLPEETAKKRLLAVVLLLVDEFRTRLAHIARTAESPKDEPFPQVMNASWYLATVFEEWADGAVVGLSCDQTLASLHESAKMYRYMWRQMCAEFVQLVRMSVILHLGDYQNENWQMLSSNEEDVTLTFCPVLNKLRWCITSAGEEISPVSFPTVFQQIVNQVAESFMDDLIYPTTFSIVGAKQMRIDMEDYLLPLLRSLAGRFSCDKGHGGWDQPLLTVISSLHLLSLPLHELRALSQSLNSLPDDVMEEKLINMGIRGIDQEMALKLVQLRNDLVTKTMLRIHN